MTSLFKFGRGHDEWKRRRRRSLLGTYETMVASGEIDASEAEERFRDILTRAQIEGPDD